MKIIAVALIFISLGVLIIAYGVKSVYDLMDGVDDKEPNNQKLKDNELPKQ